MRFTLTVLGTELISIDFGFGERARPDEHDDDHVHDPGTTASQIELGDTNAALGFRMAAIPSVMPCQFDDATWPPPA